MILGKLVIKCLQKLREVCRIPYCCHTYKLGKISNFFHFGEKLAINCVTVRTMKADLVIVLLLSVGATYKSPIRF